MSSASSAPSPASPSQEEEHERFHSSPKYPLWSWRSPVIHLLPSAFAGIFAVFVVQNALPSLKVNWFSPDCPLGAGVAQDATGMLGSSYVLKHNIDPMTNETTPCDLDYERAQRVSGMVTTAKHAVGFLLAPVLGRLSDVVGRKPMMLLSNIATMLPILGLLFTKGSSPWIYFGLSILASALAAGGGLTSAYVADVTPVHELTTAFGLIGAMFGVAMLAAQLPTAILGGGIDNQIVFRLSASLLVLNQLYIMFVVPETLPVRQPFRPKDVLKNPLKPVLALNSKTESLKWLVLFVALNTIAESGISEIAMIYMMDVLGLNEASRSKAFSSAYMGLLGFGSIFVQTVVLHVFARFGLTSKTLLLIATISNAVHSLHYASLKFYPSVSWALANVLSTTLMMIASPAVSALLSSVTSPRDQGLALATLDAVKSLVGCFAPITFSLLYANFGLKFNEPEVPFFVSAIISFAAAAVVAFGPLKDAKSARVPDPLVAPADEASDDIQAPLLAPNAEDPSSVL